MDRRRRQLSTWTVTLPDGRSVQVLALTAIEARLLARQHFRIRKLPGGTRLHREQEGEPDLTSVTPPGREVPYVPHNTSYTRAPAGGGYRVFKKGLP